MTSRAVGSLQRTWCSGLDPRDYQIAFLGCFLAYVLAFREFTLPWAELAAVFAAALLAQVGLERLFALPRSGLRSALISALSLGLLLRTDSPAVAALAGLLAISSKFLLRWRGKHFFNPTNFGILATVLLTGQAWISPGQWGSGALLAFAIAGLGLLVTRRIGRLDISLAYLGAYAGLLLLRALELGERPEVFLHRLSSGALIVFVFFMISDPRSTPDARGGRVLFATLVAVLAHVLQFRFFIPSAPIWALLLLSPLTPLLDHFWPRPRFEWRPQPEPSKGVSRAEPVLAEASSR
jgi:Na+-transporting NADH:ubiquinone oxidoreductase subunit NqrB